LVSIATFGFERNTESPLCRSRAYEAALAKGLDAKIDHSANFFASQTKNASTNRL
jgi:hypothetical protein